jgi:hypothetical protein
MTPRSPRARVAVVIWAAVLGIAAGNGAQAQGSEAPEPLSRTALDLTGDAVASAAILSKHPVGVVIGVTYKAFDLAHDIGAAAIGREDRWLGAELVLVDRDAQRLKEMKHDGVDLDGPEAAAIKRGIYDRMRKLTESDRSPAGYTASVIIKNVPYAVAKVAIDKSLEHALGFGLTRLFKHSPVPKAINWARRYGGPLEALQNGLGWGKLATRAGRAKRAADEALRDAEKKLVAKRIQQLGMETRTEAVADAVSDIYSKIMTEHRSQPRTVIASSFRLEMARQAVMLPAPVAAVPVMRAAIPEPVMRAAVPAVMRTADPDLVIRAIRSDDAVWVREPTRVPSSARSSAEPSPPAPQAEPQVDPRAEARRQALHDELMRVGDGKTFVVCSNGCPQSSASWDGRRGQTLESK